MTMNGLPPVTLSQSLDFYMKAKGLGAAALAMTDPLQREEWLAVLMSMVVVLGDKVIEQNDAILDLTENHENMEKALREAVKENLALKPGVNALQGHVDEEGRITGVAWRGSPGDYFDNFPAINHELAQGIAKMARQQLEAEKEADVREAIIEATARDSEESAD